jgi:hypothetical protein
MLIASLAMSPVCNLAATSVRSFYKHDDHEFYVMLTVLLRIILVNDQLDAQFFFYMFISIPYMFRANSFSSSGESILSIQHLVCVTPCRWPSRMQVGKELPDLHTRRSELHIPNVVLIQLILLMMSTKLLETCKSKVTPLQARCGPEGG